MTVYKGKVTSDGAYTFQITVPKQGMQGLVELKQSDEVMIMSVEDWKKFFNKYRDMEYRLKDLEK